MGNERYELKVKSDTMSFRFTSIGPKGEIPKLVVYSKTPTKGLYNLGFGDEDINTGTINDLVVTNNEDSQKVLATVASTVYEFVKKYPRAWIVATGSTRARTRLYQMGISNNLEAITTDFVVFGNKNDAWQLFEKNVTYDAFLITLKKNKRWKI